MPATEESRDEALYVLTAVLLTPAQFPSVLGDDYPEACAALGLEPYDTGYGLVLGQDGGGARWTVVTDDVSLVAIAIATWDCGMEYALAIEDRTVVASLPGWPLAVAVAAPGVPAPHDPAPDPEPGGDASRAPLAPPDSERWGPAQRRLGADEIALQWAIWREQVDSDVTFVSPGEKPHGGVRRVLEEARDYLDSPPPLGRIRSAFASGDARTLRADGPGWSMVARTDDIAFVLLDDAPGEVLPVGRGPELPGLLTALDKLAVRPH
ncbi:hypothetical protein [Streptomyces rapamycinicus]|uniref:Membrane protein n=2 Tax=Streptomyces rapamycinicus TaxID=1226757 RepID=A0A0A0N940_STRRN|nr:hypothetical protein [Streptomyces rapamycinicus]AGP52603.1 membrane protein [Streptomyces rapamycinicus NRRL 5491]MBB4780067.1 hypothetical protein [Streptomyces rapamycinicus]RLV75278.1 membrane protein [Streptomyces rapamycinicus NRRL 5491]UTO67795.1 hypothetical protein LJB45_39560 [Streptomyces rapamycinicus]UTP28770.1 hypothetical protein LIV37_04990 [Streptomyces rapamycinicus NRRL 5491]